jgi:SAM-dependent methyltransferase
MTDWGRGSYELTASQSAPVAPLVVDAAEPVENLKLLDLACGTGNAALVAARRGARVTGLDGATRLLEVAAGRADAEDLRVDWIEGDFHELPFAEDSFDVVTSVFGLIFAERPAQATAEVARILGPNGRLAITTWLDEGPMAGIQSIFQKWIGPALEQPAGESDEADEAPPFDWGDRDRLRMLFAEHGISIRCDRQALTITAESPEAQNEAWFAHHPFWLEALDLLDETDRSTLREECLAGLRAANEDRSGFRVTLPYLLALGSPV